MASDELLASLDSFFASYRSAFERRDAAAIAEHFGRTVHVATDTSGGVQLQWAGHAEWQDVIGQIVSRYRALDVGRADVRTLAATALSPRLGQARVDWRLYGRAGDVLYEFTALYTLVREGGTWRIVAIAHDEVAQSVRSRAGRPAPARARDDAGSGATG
ncbi:MAG TPA: hypothetical protein VFZ21_29345 [Gemmatimonadaceae bacterium]|jgi:hypothetical protein|nr:hypothetical protein [Gemmatimonadaceae bacterium]